MKKFLSMLGVVAIAVSLFAAAPAQASKKGMGVSCKKSSECATGYCKPNKAHNKGSSGTCQRK